MEITELTEDDFEAVLEVRNRSFGMLPADRRDWWFERRRRHLDERTALVVRDAGRAVAAAHYTSFRQWWLGRSVDMAGVGGVVVAPEYRGRGVSGLLMRGLLDRMLAAGHPLSGLFPATVPPYRKVGYELAGQRHLVTMPTSVLRGLGGTTTTVRAANAGDAQRVRDLLDRSYRDARECGSFTWPVVDYASGLAEPSRFDYLADDGFASYHWSADENLEVDWVVAGNAETARALWSQVGSHASIASTVTACLAPDDPLYWLLPDLGPVADSATDWWMHRLLDAPRAIAGRGFPPATEVDVLVEITDPELPANTGTWRLTVGDGRGSLVLHDGETPDPLRTDPRGLAALYAGTPLPTLRTAGLVTGAAAVDADLDAAFHASAISRDHF